MDFLSCSATDCWADSTVFEMGLECEFSNGALCIDWTDSETNDMEGSFDGAMEDGSIEGDTVGGADGFNGIVGEIEGLNDGPPNIL